MDLDLVSTPPPHLTTTSPLHSSTYNISTWSSEGDEAAHLHSTITCIGRHNNAFHPGKDRTARLRHCQQHP